MFWFGLVYQKQGLQQEPWREHGFTVVGIIFDTNIVFELGFLLMSKTETLLWLPPVSPSLQAATSAQYFIQMPGKVSVTLGNTQVITTSIWMHTKTHTITY